MCPATTSARRFMVAGGMAPGSIPPEATEVYQEGLRIPPVLLTPGIEAVLFANSRTGAERQGDLDAQRGANQVGMARLRALAGAPLDEVVAYGERRMRAALAEMPDGTWTFTDTLDSTGAGPVTDLSADTACAALGASAARPMPRKTPII